MKKILITGANGFIGSNLLKKIEEKGHECMSCVCGCSADKPNTYALDLLDLDNIRTIFKQFMPDVVIHLAAIAAPVHSNSSEIYNVNACGTENVFKAAEETLPKGTRIILISTAGVYGKQDAERLSESSPFNPGNHYSCSKMITEFWSRQYSDIFDITIVRPFNIIGRGQRCDFFVPKLVKHFKEKQPVIKLGNMSSVRDYVPCSLCTDVLLKLAENSGKNPPVLNICTGTGHSCTEVVKTLEELTGFHPQIEVTSDFVRKNELHHLVGDPSLLSQFMGYDVSGDYLRETLKDILENS